MIGIIEKARNASELILPNTFIGGVATTIPDAQSLAAKLQIAESDIGYFATVGSDIEATINVRYSLPHNCFDGDTNITYYRDEEDLCVSLGNVAFRNSTLSSFKFNGVTKVLTGCFQYCDIPEYYLPKVNYVESGSFGFIENATRIYITKCTRLGSTVLNNSVFHLINSGCVIYVNPYLATVDNGSPDGDLTYAASRGAIIRYVDNLIRPDSISDLNIDKIYDTLQLNFTPPASANTIDFYEVWDALTNKKLAEISAPNSSITGLNAETSYQIYLITVDEFYNKSEISNLISIKTGAAFTYQGTTPSDIFTFRRIANFRNECVRLERSNDLEETDVLLPVSGFISMTSEVSAGGTLGDWIGGNDGIVKRVYNSLRPGKDLVFTNGDYKLITGGVLNTINGKPAISISSGKGLEAVGINEGNPLVNASMFVVYQNNSTINSNRAAGFGNYSVDLNGTGKKHWNPAGDNSLRFDGGAITSNSVAPVTGAKVRSSFKNGDSYSDFINGVQNISPTTLTGTSIVDDFYVGVHTPDLLFSEAIVYLSDETANQATIESEQNSVYQIF